LLRQSLKCPDTTTALSRGSMDPIQMAEYPPYDKP